MPENHWYQRMNCVRRKSPVLCYDELNPQARSVIMLVHLLNVNIEMRPIELFRGEQYTLGYEMLNHAQTVPVLVHNDVILTDSHTILMYISENFEGRYGQQLFPSYCYIRRLQIVDKLFFESAILHRRHSEFMTEIIRKTYANTDVVFHEKRILSAYAMLESYLGNCWFIVGNMVTIADLAIVATVSALDIMFPIENGKDKWPRLCNWFCRMRSLPVYALNYNGILKQREIIEAFGGFEFPAPISQNMQSLSSGFSCFRQCVPQPQSIPQQKYVPQYVKVCSVKIEEVESAEVSNSIRTSSTGSIKNLEQIMPSLPAAINECDEDFESTDSKSKLDQTGRSSLVPTEELDQTRQSSLNPTVELDKTRRSSLGLTEELDQTRQSSLGPTVELDQSRRPSLGLIEELDKIRQSSLGPTEEQDQTRQSSLGPTVEQDQTRRLSLLPKEELNQTKQPSMGLTEELDQAERSARDPTKQLDQTRHSSLSPTAELDQTKRSSLGSTEKLEQMRQSLVVAIKEFKESSVTDLDQIRRLSDQKPQISVNERKGKIRSNQKGKLSLSKKYQDNQKKTSVSGVREKSQNFPEKSIHMDEITRKMFSNPIRNKLVNEGREKSQTIQKKNGDINKAREKFQIIQKRNKFINEGRENLQDIQRGKIMLSSASKDPDNKKSKLSYNNRGKTKTETLITKTNDENIETEIKDKEPSYNDQGNRKASLKVEALKIKAIGEKTDTKTNDKKRLQVISASQQTQRVCTCGTCSSCRASYQNESNMSSNYSPARVSCMIKQFEENKVNCSNGVQNQNRWCKPSCCMGNANTCINVDSQRMSRIMETCEKKYRKC